MWADSAIVCQLWVVALSVFGPSELLYCCLGSMQVCVRVCVMCQQCCRVIILPSVIPHSWCSVNCLLTVNLWYTYAYVDLHTLCCSLPLKVKFSPLSSLYHICHTLQVKAAWNVLWLDISKVKCLLYFFEDTLVPTSLPWFGLCRVGEEVSVK